MGGDGVSGIGRGDVYFAPAGGGGGGGGGGAASSSGQYLNELRGRLNSPAYNYLVKVEQGSSGILRADLNMHIARASGAGRVVGVKDIITLIAFMATEVLPAMDAKIAQAPPDVDDYKFARLMVLVKISENFLLLARYYAQNGKKAEAAAAANTAENILLALLGKAASPDAQGFVAAAQKSRQNFDASIPYTYTERGGNQISGAKNSFAFALAVERFGFSEVHLGMVLAEAYKLQGENASAAATRSSKLTQAESELERLFASEDIGRTEKLFIRDSYYDYVLGGVLALVEIKNALGKPGEALQAADNAKNEMRRNLTEVAHDRGRDRVAFMRLAVAMITAYSANGQADLASALSSAYQAVDSAARSDTLTPELVKALLTQMGFDVEGADKNACDRIIFTYKGSSLAGEIQDPDPSKKKDLIKIIIKQVKPVAFNFVGTKLDEASRLLDEALRESSAPKLKRAIDLFKALLADPQLLEGSEAATNAYYVVQNLVRAYNSKLYENKVAPAGDRKYGHKVAAALCAARLGDSFVGGVLSGTANSFAQSTESGQILQTEHLKAAQVIAKGKESAEYKKFGDVMSLAEALRSLSEYDNAAKFYDWAITDRSTSSAEKDKARFGKAECLLFLAKEDIAQNQTDRARAQIDAATALAMAVSGDTVAVSTKRNLTLAWAHAMQGDLADDKAAYRTALSAAAENYAAIIRATDGANGSAAAAVIREAELSVSDIRFRLGETYKNLDRYSEALVEFNRVGAEHPRYDEVQVARAEALFNRGWAEGRADDIKTAGEIAWELYQKTLPSSSDPSSPSVAPAQLAVDPEQLNGFYQRLGNVLKQDQKFSAAIDLFEKIPASDQQYWPARIGAAEAYAERGRTTKDSADMQTARERALEVFRHASQPTSTVVADGREPAPLSLANQDLAARAVYTLSGYYGYQAERKSASIDPTEYQAAQREREKSLVLFGALLGADDVQTMASGIDGFEMPVSNFDDDPELQEVVARLSGGQLVDVKPDAKTYYVFGQLVKEWSKLSWAAAFFEKASTAETADATTGFADEIYRVRARVAQAEILILEAKQKAKEAKSADESKAAQVKTKQAIAALNDLFGTWSTSRIPDGTEKNALLASALITLSWAYGSQADIEQNFDEAGARADFLKAATVYRWLLDSSVMFSDADEANLKLFAAWTLPAASTLNDPQTLAAIGYSKEKLQLNFAGLLKVCGKENEQILIVAQEQFNEVFGADHSQSSSSLLTSDPELYYAASAGLAETYVYRARVAAANGDASQANTNYTEAVRVCTVALSAAPRFGSRGEVVAAMGVMRVFAWAQGDVLQKAEKDDPFNSHADAARSVAGVDLLLADPAVVAGLNISEKTLEATAQSSFGSDFSEKWNAHSQYFAHSGIYRDSGIDNAQVVMNAAYALITAGNFEAADKALVYVSNSASGVLQAEAKLALGDLYCWHGYSGGSLKISFRGKQWQYETAREQYRQATIAAQALPDTPRKKEILFDATMGKAKCLYETKSFASAGQKFDEAIDAARQHLAEVQAVGPPNMQDVLTGQKRLLRALDGKRNMLVWAKKGNKYYFTSPANKQEAGQLEAEIRGILAQQKAASAFLFDPASQQYDSELAKQEILLDISTLDQRVFIKHDYGVEYFLGSINPPTAGIIAQYDQLAGRIYDSNKSQWILRDRESPQILARIYSAQAFVYTETGEFRKAAEMYQKANDLLNRVGIKSAQTAQLQEEISGATGEAVNNVVDHPDVSVDIGRVASQSTYVSTGSVNAFEGWLINARSGAFHNLDLTGRLLLGEYYRFAQIPGGDWMYAQSGGEAGVGATVTLPNAWAGQFRFGGNVGAGADASWLKYKVIETEAAAADQTYTFGEGSIHFDASGSMTLPSGENSRFFTTFSVGGGVRPSFMEWTSGSPYMGQPLMGSGYGQGFASFKVRRAMAGGLVGAGSSATLGVRVAYDPRGKTSNYFYELGSSPLNVGLVTAVSDRIEIPIKGRTAYLEPSFAASLPLTHTSTRFLNPAVSFIAPWAARSGQQGWGWELLPDRLKLDWQWTQEKQAIGKDLQTFGQQFNATASWGF